MTEKAADYGCTNEMSYPVLAASEKLKVRRGKSVGIDSTSFLIANDSYSFMWIPATECEFVDLT
jgi:hypothetical protein